MNIQALKLVLFQQAACSFHFLIGIKMRTAGMLSPVDESESALGKQAQARFNVGIGIVGIRIDREGEASTHFLEVNHFTFLLSGPRRGRYRNAFNHLII